MVRGLRTVGLVGAVALLGLTAGTGIAHAGGCCGGGGRAGGYSGGYGGGHTFGRTAYAGHSAGGMSCCSMGGMGMGGMNMAAMPMAPAQTYGVNMQAMPMNGYAAPAAAPGTAAAARYTCPMHPGVVSATPGSCPYCGMALTRR